MKDTKCFDCQKVNTCRGVDECKGFHSVYRFSLIYRISRFFLSILFLFVLVVPVFSEETYVFTPIKATIIPGNAQIVHISCSASISTEVDKAIYTLEYMFLATEPGFVKNRLAFPAQVAIYRAGKSGDIQIGASNALFYADMTKEEAAGLVKAFLEGEKNERDAADNQDKQGD